MGLWRSIAHRIVSTPAASRLWWVGSRVRTRSSARELDIGRAHITPLLKVVHEQPANQQSLSAPSLTVQVASAHAHVHKASATQLTQPSYLAHTLCANKLFHKQGVFGHRAILILPGIETWLGGFKYRVFVLQGLWFH